MNEIPKEVSEFRKAWLPKVPSWYSARWHYFGTSAVSFPLIAYGLSKLINSSSIESLTWMEWASIPFFFVTASLVEYLVHKYPLHRKLPLGSHAYTQHTLRHHQYYTDQAIEAVQAKEYHLVLFPVWGVILIQYAVNLPYSMLVGTLAGERFGWIGLVVGVLFFFIYETIHAICHFPVESGIFKIPGLWFLREHHRIHHRKNLMAKKNFNIVFPIWDWILK